MRHNGTDNLIPFDKLPEEKQREIRSKGAMASAEKRRQKKTLKQELEILLEMMDKNGHTNQEKISMAILAKAGKGDTKAYEVIRDTIGQKPVERVETTEVPVIKDDV